MSSKTTEQDSLLVQRAEWTAIRPALIQNGNDPDVYSEDGASLEQESPVPAPSDAKHR